MERGLVEVSCPGCGPIVVGVSAMTCGISDADGAALCQLECPECRHLLHRPIDPNLVAALLLFGARRAGRPLPFELAEPHRGAAVTWDEVLDLHIELERDCCPHERLLHA